MTCFQLIYNCADVFALPSIQEGQGIVLLEAQASAKPVVAFDIGGVNEAVVNGETGLLVKRGSVDQLADAIIKLLSDKALREKMGGNGRKFVMANFTWDICAQKMLQVYREALWGHETLTAFASRLKSYFAHPFSLKVTADSLFAEPQPSCFLDGISVSFNFSGSLNIVISGVKELFPFHMLLDMA